MPNNYVLLDRVELNATAASVVFDNIPQSGYTDLKIVLSGRNTSAGDDQVWISFNGSTTGFSNIVLYGNGSGAGQSGAIARYVANVTTSGYTANTFSNCEIYIPNYRSSNFKSISADAVNENNATTAFAVLVSTLWSNTAAITSITLTTSSGTAFETNSTFSLYGLAQVGTTPAIAPKADGGNVIGTDGTYWYHQFNTNGTFTPQVALICDYLVVAGGGSGAGEFVGGTTLGGGGGGAGGYRTSIGGSPLSLNSNTNYTVTIGAGGAGPTGDVVGVSGSNSVFATITSAGGGGASGHSFASLAGGSGGGAGVNSTPGAGNTPSTSPAQGFAGGNGHTAGPGGGGGGGGATAVGANASGTTGGAGGAGASNSITGTAVTYSIGGNGRTASGQSNGANATANTGNGGEGSTTTGPNTTGGSGGSGIVVVRYLVA